MRRMIFTLTVVALISGTALALVYSALLPRIEHNQQVALERSLSALYEEGDSPQFSEMDTEGPTMYRATEDGELIGYAVRVVTTGYGGEITLLVGLGPGLERITGMEVVEHVETPGLGAKINSSSFKDQFEGLQPSGEISFVKGGPAEGDENEVQAISGATISTEAVVEGINKRLDDAVPILSEKEGL
ncbi:MAG: RnfABCDGE type electron transport complex subunit G [Spirochaetia bacterium]